jgi:ABC-type multidrug transport system fused ATPase/permease subunit
MIKYPKNPRIKEVPKGLTAVHLSKAYKKRPVLRDISLSIQRGEAVAWCLEPIRLHPVLPYNGYPPVR